MRCFSSAYSFTGTRWASTIGSILLALLKNHALVVYQFSSKAFLVVAFTKEFGSASKLLVCEETRYEPGNHKEPGKTSRGVFEIGEGEIPDLAPFADGLKII